MSNTSNRKEHQEQVHAAQNSELRPPSVGKKGGEIPTSGHGPSTGENRSTNHGKDKDKKKSD